MKSLEQQRVAIQEERDAAKTQQERNRLGQFATPTALARDILLCAQDLLPTAEQVRFLDPAIGTGSFFSALLDTFPSNQIGAAEGFELDPHYGEPCKELWEDTSLKVHLTDFTKAPPPSEKNRFNLIICNPPYVRHHHLSKEDKARLQDASKLACGSRVGGLAGLYCYFLALSHPWLSDGGIAGWLIPSEFMDVNYGQAIKDYLLDRVTLLRVHRFDPKDVQFESALVSSAVVWFQNTPPPTKHEVEFTFGGTLLRPRQSRLISEATLRREAKWTRFPVSRARENHNGVTLGDLFSIKRGLATGANRFFILTRDQIEQHDLPIHAFRPILPSPRHIEDNEIFADDDGLPLVDPQLFLLDCRLPEDQVKREMPSLWRYLQTGKPKIAGRYLCRNRSPWYVQENRPSSPFVCTYMGRSDTKNGKPFRFILNHSNATAANVYLLLYPKPALARALENDHSLLRSVWMALEEIRAQELLDEGRVYGGGLHKVEPKELANVPADRIARLLSRPVKIYAHQPVLFPELVPAPER